MTPADAHQIGSDYIVVGRPITQAEDPVAAYHDYQGPMERSINFQKYLIS